MLSEVGIDVKILNMSGAKDPDEYIQKFGANRFSQLLNESKTRIEFEINKLLSMYNINNVNDKIKASQEICGIIATYSSSVERELYCRYAAGALNISEDSLKNDVAKTMSRNAKREKTVQMQEIYRASSGIGDKVNTEAASNIRAARTEEAILGMMQLHEEHLSKCAKELSPDDFVTSFNRRVFLKMVESFENNGKFDIAFVEEDFNIDEISRITKTLIDRQSLDSNGADVLDSCIKSLKAEKNKVDAVSNIDSLEDLFKRKK